MAALEREIVTEFVGVVEKCVLLRSAATCELKTVALPESGYRNTNKCFRGQL